MIAIMSSYIIKPVFISTFVSRTPKSSVHGAVEDARTDSPFQNHNALSPTPHRKPTTSVPRMTEHWLTGHQGLSLTGEHHGHGRSHHGKRERTRQGHHPPCPPARGGGSHPHGEHGDGAHGPHRPSCHEGERGNAAA